MTNLRVPVGIEMGINSVCFRNIALVVQMYTTKISVNFWPPCHQCPEIFHNIISLSHSCSHLTLPGPDSVGYIHYMCVSFGPPNSCQDGIRYWRDLFVEITAKNKGVEANRFGGKGFQSVMQVWCLWKRNQKERGLEGDVPQTSVQPWEMLI